MAALVLIWATLEEDRLVWRGIRMDSGLRQRIAEAARTAPSASSDVSVLDRYLEATQGNFRPAGKADRLGLRVRLRRTPVSTRFRDAAAMEVGL